MKAESRRCFVIKMANVSFHIFVFFMKWNDNTASERVIVYDTVMMQQNIFQGEMHITKCCLSQQRKKNLCKIDTAYQ